MKTFEEFRKGTTIAEKPVYVRKDGELSYDVSEDVYAPGITPELSFHGLS